MSANDPLYDAPADWDAVFANPAISEVTHYAPPNSSARHTDGDDARILENAKRQAPWLRQILNSIAATES